MDDFIDPYLIKIGDIELLPELNLLESVTQIKEFHGWRIGSVNEIGPKHRFEIFSCDDSNEIMCTGSAVGLDEKNMVRHFWSGNNLRFLGILRCHLGDGKALVITRGHVVMDSSRWANAPHIRDHCRIDAGEPVYSSHPKFFHLGIQPDAIEIGKMSRLLKVTGSPFQVAIVFKRSDDAEPLDMSFRADLTFDNVHYHDIRLHRTPAIFGR